MEKKPSAVVAMPFGILFLITMLGIAIYFPEPTPFQYTVFRSVLALAAAGVATMLPELFKLKLRGVRIACGAIAVFLIVYAVTPAAIPVNEKSRVTNVPADSSNGITAPRDPDPRNGDSGSLADQTQPPYIRGPGTPPETEGISAGPNTPSPVDTSPTSAAESFERDLGDVRFRLENCRGRGTNVICAFTLTATATDATFRPGCGEISRMFDDIGRETPADHMYFADKYLDSRYEATLVQGITTAGQYTFQDTRAEARTISLLRLHFCLLDNPFEIEFRGVPIQRSEG